ncbi:MAG: Hsp20 family protein [Prevotella sp.]|jgi:HSP20 family protein|nr:Hsp20 family protein [Prevotella sp.]
MRNQIRRFDRTGSFLPSFFNHYLNDDLYNNIMSSGLPATNISENEKEYIVELSVPGFKKEDINIEVEKNILKISAQSEMKNEEKDQDQKVLRREFKKSSFTRSFSIPENIDIENIMANQEDGVLRVILPKQLDKEEDKIKKIEIQ